MTAVPVDAPRPRSLAAGYAVAVIASTIAGAVQYFLQPILGERFLLAAFPAAVVVAAWFGGYGAGLLATLTGSLTAVYFFLRPAQSVQIDDPANAASLLLFILVGLLISLAVRHLRQEMRVERDARTETERQLRRTASLQQLTATLSRATTPVEVMRTSLPELLHAVDATAGAVLLIAADGSECELAHAIGYADRPVTPGHKFTLTAPSPLADAIRRRELVESAAMLAVEAAPASGEPRPWVREGDLVVPLIAAGRVIGAAIVTILPPRLVDGEEGRFLLSAGRHTAQALDRARLYETAERARTEAEGLRVRADTEPRRQKAQKRSG